MARISAFRVAAWGCYMLATAHGLGCYNPNGNAIQDEATNEAWVPCNQVAGQFSSCCITNRTSDLDTTARDSCQANGLCGNFYTWPNGTTTTLWWAPLCSDPTWKSPNCLANLCPSDTWTAKNGRPALANCSDNMWCCDPDANQSCCNDASKKFTLAAVVGKSPRSSSSSAAPSSTSTAATSPPAAGQQTTAPSSSSNGLSSGAIAGIVVGCVLGVIILAVGALLLWRRRSSRGTRNVAEGLAEVERKQELPAPPAELHADALRAEADTRMPPAELDAGNDGRRHQ